MTSYFDGGHVVLAMVFKLM
ncbi:hypothetical protein VTO73DRAFT_13852 [Trametes versicolor]